MFEKFGHFSNGMQQFHHAVQDHGDGDKLVERTTTADVTHTAGAADTPVAAAACTDGTAAATPATAAQTPVGSAGAAATAAAAAAHTAAHAST